MFIMLFFIVIDLYTKIIRIFSVVASIIQNPNGMPPMNIIKIENPGYYCSSFTPPGDHSSIMASGSYSEYNITLQHQTYSSCIQILYTGLR